MPGALILAAGILLKKEWPFPPWEKGPFQGPGSIGGAPKAIRSGIPRSRPQNMIFAAICIVRGSRTVPIWPNAVLVTFRLVKPR